MAWVPTTDFEEEIVDSQPDHNFIFGRLCETTQQQFYPRPKEHLDFIAKQKNVKNNQDNNLPSSQNPLNIIARVQRIAGTKPLGEQPTIDDWNDNENLERETIALMRHVGLGPSIEYPLDEACTIATHPIKEEIKINRNGRKQMPIFFDEKFFALKPRVSSSPSSSGKSSPVLFTEGAMGAKDDSTSSTSVKSSSIATSSDLLHEQSIEGGNSGFESASSFVRDEESFKTARSSNSNGNRWRGKRKDSKKLNIQNWRSDSKEFVKTQSNSNWRSSSNSAYHKEENASKNSPKLCTPKELYQRKRQT